MDFLQGKSLKHKENELVLADVAMKKKLLILYYFTVVDSDACRSFDRKLKVVYQEALERQIELGIVVVPGDVTKESYLKNLKINYSEYYSVQFGDDLQQLLTYNFGITHVPALIVVDKSGSVVTRSGVKDIESFGINVLVTWLD